MTNKRTIYCCGCGHDVQARLTNGAEVHAYVKRLRDTPFWRCDTCRRTVGCHHKTLDRTKPLGVIPTQEISRARRAIHYIIDPLWDGDRNKRAIIYRKISDRLGYRYHTAEIRSVDEAKEVLRIAKELEASL
jgi:hypothetical protein